MKCLQFTLFILTSYSIQAGLGMSLEGKISDEYALKEEIHTYLGDIYLEGSAATSEDLQRHLTQMFNITFEKQPERFPLFKTYFHDIKQKNTNTTINEQNAFLLGAVKEFIDIKSIPLSLPVN